MKVKGKEVIVLEEYADGGFVSIEVEKLTMKMEDIFTEEQLLEAEVNMPPGFRKMLLIAVIKSNIAGNDSMGYRRHKQVLLDEGFDV